MKKSRKSRNTSINLETLSEKERKFYDAALEKYHKNTNWVEFDDFAFGMKSPIYENKHSHLEVLKDSLYLTLKELSMELGVRQGFIAYRNKKLNKTYPGTEEEVAKYYFKEVNPDNKIDTGKPGFLDNFLEVLKKQQSRDQEKIIIVWTGPRHSAFMKPEIINYSLASKDLAYHLTQLCDKEENRKWKIRADDTRLKEVK